MKTHIALIVAVLTALVSTQAAETPDAIAADYRARATTALEKVNATLEKATVPIIADLVKAGDTTGADEVKAQLKAKQDGEPVAKPHAKAANLFTLYDAAHLRALDPIQQATIRKLDAVLAGADGKKLEVVDAVKTARAEVEAGRINSLDSAPSSNWTFHRTRSGPSDGAVVFGPNGDVTFISKVGNKSTGTWTKTKPDTIVAKFPADEWKINFRKSGAEVKTTSSQQICYLELAPPP